MLHCGSDVEAYGSVEWHPDFDCLCRSTNELEGASLTYLVNAPESELLLCHNSSSQSMSVHELSFTCEPDDMTTSRRSRSSLSGAAMLSHIVSAYSLDLLLSQILYVGSRGINTFIVRSSETRSGPGYFAAIYCMIVK